MRLPVLFAVLVLMISPVQADGDPDNYTLELGLDASNVYVSGSETGENTFQAGELEFPYIISGQPAGIVSYGEPVQLEYENSSRDIFRVTQESGGFLVPNTLGSYKDIEKKQSQVASNSLLHEKDPSFTFYTPDNPVIKVILATDFATEGFSGIERGVIEMTVRKTSRPGNRTVIKLQPG